MCVPGGGVCAWLTRQQRARALRWYQAECRAPTESILFAQGPWATTSSVPRSCGSVMVRGCGSVLLQWLSRLLARLLHAYILPVLSLHATPLIVRCFGRAGRNSERQRPVSITTARTLWRTGTFMLDHGCIPVCRLTQNPCTCILTSNSATQNSTHQGGGGNGMMLVVIGLVVAIVVGAVIFMNNKA